METDLHALVQARFGVKPAESAPGLRPELGPAAASRLAALLGRSVCRQYRPDEVPASLLDLLLACAQSAPSKSDLQQYSIIVVDTAARLQIAAWLPTMPWIAEAPVFLVFCGDIHRNRQVCAQHGRPHANDNVDSFLNGAVDAALALSAFMQAADSAGLGSCPISYVRNHLPEIRDLLGLPPGVVPVAGLCVGFPVHKAEPPRGLSMRLPPRVVVHRGRYDDTGFPEELADYDARRHLAAPIPPEKQKNTRIYGASAECTWSDQVSRQLSQPERAHFSDFLRDHGFALK